VHEATVSTSAAGVLKVVAEDHIDGGDVWRRMPVAAMSSTLADITHEVTANVRLSATSADNVINLRSRRQTVLVCAHLPTTTTALPAFLFGRLRRFTSSLFLTVTQNKILQPFSVLRNENNE